MIGCCTLCGRLLLLLLLVWCSPAAPFGNWPLGEEREREREREREESDYYYYSTAPAEEEEEVPLILFSVDDDDDDEVIKESRQLKLLLLIFRGAEQLEVRGKLHIVEMNELKGSEG